MTKYVVQSGSVYKSEEQTRKFYAEIVKGLGATPKILICNFAQPREDWNKKFTKDVERLMLYPENCSPELEMAFPDTFPEQIRDCDVLHIHGGDDRLLQSWMSEFNLPSLWKDKAVVTNSAGSNLIATHYWTCDWRQVGNGLGILPIKFLAHYQSNYGADDDRGLVDWEVAKKELENYGDTSLPVYALEEGEFIVFEK